MPGLMIVDAGEHISEPGLRVYAVKLGGADQRIDHRRAFARAIGAAEQPRLAAESASTASGATTASLLRGFRPISASSKNLRLACAQHAASSTGPGLRSRRGWARPTS